MSVIKEVTEPTLNTQRPARDVLDDCRTAIQPALRAAVDTLPGPVRRITGYHLGWWDEQGRAVTASGGKTLRATLVRLTAEAVGGDPGAAVPAAVAVELVHNFSLLHDDVMDGDETRRHRPTAWAVFGANPAILAGDSLLTLAFHVLAEGGPAGSGARVLATAVQALVSGQCADLEFETRNDVTLAECVRMAEEKTGALLGCACELGALAGGAEPARARRLRSFGERLGLAFQLVDDLLGIWGEEAVTGKPVYSDLRNRKKSLPVVKALTSGTPAGRALARMYRGDQPPAGDALPRAARLVEQAGGRAWSQGRADALLAGALADLASAGGTARATAELGTLARLVARRDH